MSPFASVTSVLDEVFKLVVEGKKYPPSLMVAVTITPATAAEAEDVALNRNATTSFETEP